MDYVCNFLNHNGSYIGPRTTIYRSSLDSAIEDAFERLASHPDYQGFDLLQDGVLSCCRFRGHRDRCFMELEVGYGTTAIYARVQA